MNLTASSSDLLATLPGALGTVTVHAVDRDGRLLATHGPCAPPVFRVRGGELEVSGEASSHVSVHAVGRQGWLVACHASACSAESRDAIHSVLRVVAERESLEQDMESMNTGALQLMEQVAMVGETLPQLSGSASDIEVVTKGLHALLVASGVERALYVRNLQREGLGEILVTVEGAGAGRPMVLTAAHQMVSATEGLLADVLAAEDVVVMRDAMSDDPIGGLARSQVLGAPVCYGQDDRRVVLGALFVFDKSTESYSGARKLGSEEGQVLHCYAAMLGSVLGARKVAEMGKELSMATAIQKTILPSGPARVAGFDLAALYQTSGEVGGDYFDYVPLADGSTLAVVADVSGHNLASGMIMVSVRASLRTLASQSSSPAELFERLAHGVYDDLTRTERFLTAAAATLSPNRSEVHLVNAGHADALHYVAATGEVRSVPGNGTVLGFLPNPSYEAVTIRLEPGDALLLYTDGIVECSDGAEVMFGEDRLAQVFGESGGGSAGSIVAAVTSAVQAFAGNQLADDMTALVIKARNASEVTQ